MTVSASSKIRAGMEGRGKRMLFIIRAEENITFENVTVPFYFSFKLSDAAAAAA